LAEEVCAGLRRWAGSGPPSLTLRSPHPRPHLYPPSPPFPGRRHKLLVARRLRLVQWREGLTAAWGRRRLARCAPTLAAGRWGDSGISRAPAGVPWPVRGIRAPLRRRVRRPRGPGGSPSPERTAS